MGRPVRHLCLFAALVSSFILTPPAAAQYAAGGFRGVLTNGPAVSSASGYANLAYGGTVFNSAGLSVAGDGTITINQAGLYTFSGHVGVVPDAGAPYVSTRVLVNGAQADLNLMGAENGRWNGLGHSFTRQFAAGDTVQLQAAGNQVQTFAGATWDTLNVVRHATAAGTPSGAGFRGTLTNAGAVASSSGLTNLAFTNVTLNAAGLSVGANGVITVNQTGLYSFAGHLDVIADSGAPYPYSQILVNGAVVDYNLTTARPGRWQGMTTSYLGVLTAGSTVQFQMDGNSVAAMDNGDWSTLTAVRHDPVGGQPSATGFRGRLTNASAAAVPSAGGYTNLNFGNVALNSAGLTVQPDGSVVVGAAGLYSIDGHIVAVPDAGAPYVDLHIRKNGVLVDTHMMTAQPSQWSGLSYSYLSELSPGDVLTFQMDGSKVTALSFLGEYSTLNVIHFTPVPEPTGVLLVAGLGVGAVAVARRWRARHRSGEPTGG